MESKGMHNEALEEAYLLLRKRLDAIASGYKVSEEDAEDFIQEGYLRLSDKIIRSPEEAKGKLWITIRNLAIDSFRRKKFTTSLDDKSPEINLNSTDSSFVDYSGINSKMESILSPLQYKIMTMLVGRDMDYSEIAIALDIKEGTVRTNVCRARKLLKEHLEK